MTAHHSFDEVLISGFVDGELTQADAQRVLLHIEGCSSCRALTESLLEMKELTMTSRFHVPDDSLWDERPRSRTSRTLRRLGWTLLVIWAASTAGYALWQASTERQNLFQVAIVVGFWLAVGALFASVTVDQVRSGRSDRYRKVEK